MPASGAQLGATPSEANDAARRALDIAIAATLLVLLTPLLLLTVVVVRCADGGPAIFWQRRVGRAGREFWFPKFRSMYVGAEREHDVLLSLSDDQETIRLKMRNDPRITQIGRLLRTLSIDELPQLWSVLRGDMAMVGPRPPLPAEVARYDARAMRRLDVKPGITGPWQVHGRSLIPFDEQISLDLEYIEQRSVALDLKLILLTIPAVLSCRGAW